MSARDKAKIAFCSDAIGRVKRNYLITRRTEAVRGLHTGIRTKRHDYG